MTRRVLLSCVLSPPSEEVEQGHSTPKREANKKSTGKKGIVGRGKQIRNESTTEVQACLRHESNRHQSDVTEESPGKVELDNAQCPTPIVYSLIKAQYLKGYRR
jgi:hypothetical protein